MEVLRKLQQQPDGIREWYNKLQQEIERLGVVPQDMWNMDETGCRIGVAKNQYVYTARGKNNIVLPSSNNRELVTLVECMSATGASIEPMVIVKSSTIFEHWVEQLPDKYAVQCSDTGYTNDELAFQWLQHFDKLTKDNTVGVWRLLLVDGDGSHLTREFYEYAIAHKIQPFALPPHLSHLLQPLDVGCFQPLKWYHGLELDHASRTGARDINKADFLSTIESIRCATFTVSTIRSGWRRTGLYPFKPDLVINELKTQEQIDVEERNEPEDSWVVAIEQQEQDWDVQIRRTTPDLHSSEVEVALGDTLVRVKLST